MAYNSARRKDVRENEKLAKITEIQRRELVAGIMSVAPGRAWMCDLLEFCNCFATTFNSNPVAMAFNEGQRNVGVRLLGDIMESCPNLYVDMMKERSYKDAARDTRTGDRDARDAVGFFDPPASSAGAEQPGSQTPNGGAEGRPVSDADPEDGWVDTVYGPHEAGTRKNPAQ